MNEIKESMDENEYKSEPKESILERHRLERKELNAKITELRHSLTKGDKKKKKELNSQIDSLNEELKKRHEKELKDLNDSQLVEESINELTNQLKTISGNEHKKIVSDDSEVVTNGIKYNETKISRAQKKREAKALKQKQRQQEIEDQSLPDSENPRLIEAQKLMDILSSRGLAVCEIASDGDCMYRAIGHQLSLKNIMISVPELRQKTCDYMKENKQDFIPFLSSPSTGDLMNDSEYELYCNDIANTKSWGGQLELRAVSHIFKTPIEVIQAETNSVLIGQFDYRTEQPLILCYLRHAYSLGEHYNSVQSVI